MLFGIVQLTQQKGAGHAIRTSKMSTVDPNQRFVQPLQGTGLSLFVVSIVGGIMSLIVVGLRTFHRLRARNFSLDDGLMLGGLVSNILDDGTLLTSECQRPDLITY